MNKMLLSVILLTIVIISSLGSPANTQNPQGSQSRQTTQPDNTCNPCCQGADGIPGFPGPAGHNGLPGREGLRGEKGDPGLGMKGQKGEIGLRGDVGYPGEHGPQGPIGIKGQKGSTGEAKKSAFTAVKTQSQPGRANEVVTFQETTTNTDLHFDLETNKFTCEHPGTYFFMCSMGVYQNGAIHIPLMKNGVPIVTAHARVGGFSNDYDTASISAVLDLAKGDKVWLQFPSVDGETIFGSEGRYSSFTGFLLYEE